MLGCHHSCVKAGVIERSLNAQTSGKLHLEGAECNRATRSLRECSMRSVFAPRFRLEHLDTFMRAVIFRNYKRRVADAANPSEPMADKKSQGLTVFVKTSFF
jgi:hypothetical protein